MLFHITVLYHTAPYDTITPPHCIYFSVAQTMTLHYRSQNETLNSYSLSTSMPFLPTDESLGNSGSREKLVDHIAKVCVHHHFLY